MQRRANPQLLQPGIPGSLQTIHGAGGAALREQFQHWLHSFRPGTWRGGLGWPRLWRWAERRSSLHEHLRQQLWMDSAKLAELLELHAHLRSDTEIAEAVNARRSWYRYFSKQ